MTHPCEFPVSSSPPPSFSFKLFHKAAARRFSHPRFRKFLPHGKNKRSRRRGFSQGLREKLRKFNLYPKVEFFDLRDTRRDRAPFAGAKLIKFVARCCLVVTYEKCAPRNFACAATRKSLLQENDLFSRSITRGETTFPETCV